MFYSGVDGILLVHDLTNRKSEENLKSWLNEILDENESISIMGSSELLSYIFVLLI
jgi:Rab-like protein 3